jgi:hypothetical protein
MPEPPVTEEEYQPDSEIEELVLSELESAKVSYSTGEDIELSDGMSASQQNFEMVLNVDSDEFNLLGNETYTPIGVFMSFEGNLGFASGIILYHTRLLGVPTNVYADEFLSGENPSDEYQDLTAEWYRQSMVENNSQELQSAQRAVDSKQTIVSIEELERYARQWLSRD